MKFYTVAQLSEMLAISPSTVYRWVKENTGPLHHKVNGKVLFKDSDVADFIERCTVRRGEP